MKPHFAQRQLSKLLSYILGRRPYEFGLVPEEKGYVSIQMLLKAIWEEKDWKYIRESHVHELLPNESDPTVELAGNRIRAVDRSHLPVPVIITAPPKLLYVCVRHKAYAHVLENGISASAYWRVVLSSDKDMALRIGRRNDPKPVLLTVYCNACMEQGIVFYQAGGVLFTAEYIPKGCFSGPAPTLEKDPKHQQTPVPLAQIPKTPGSFTLEIQNEKPSHQKVKGRKKEIVWKKNRKKLLKNPEYL
jgi:putative RNA 2'-phosphotransferase